MRAWMAPLAVGAIVAVAAFHIGVGAVPRGLMSVATGRIAQAGGINHMAFAPLATDRSRLVVRPSPDLAYASCPFDLAERPLLIEAAAVDAPYWSLSVFDGRTNAAFVRNNLQARNAPMRIALVRPGQPAPAGVEAVTVPTRRGIALIRILIPDRAAFAAIDAARRASFCRSL